MEELQSQDDLSLWDKHRFLLLILLTIIVSIGLVSISLAIYTSSGAELLDLSRPGYQATKTPLPSLVVDTYSADGPVNAKTISQFQTLYNKQVANTNAVDAFGGDPLDPDSLGIGATANTTTPPDQ